MKNRVLSTCFILMIIGFINANSIQPLESSAVNSIIPVGTRMQRNIMEAPGFNFHIMPQELLHSYYDYFPGGFDTIPIRGEVRPGDIYDEDGIYLLFTGTASPSVMRRAYYTYIEEDQIVAGPDMINLNGTSEIFQAVDTDTATGYPFVVWSSGVGCMFLLHRVSDIPPAWYEPYLLMDDAFQPAVFVGASPQPGLKRVYVIAKSYAVTGIFYEKLAFADFQEPSDIAFFDDDQWTFIDIPFLSDWHAADIHTFAAPVVSPDNSHLAIVGHTQYFYSTDPYHPNNFLFILENDNYGEGDWTLHTGDPTIPIDNPDGYFTDSNDQPYQDMRYRIQKNRHNTVIDDQNNYHFAAYYELFVEIANCPFPADVAVVKHIKFDRNTEEFVLTDLYPRHEDGESLYLPWSIPPEYDGDGNLMINISYPCYWWDGDGMIGLEIYQRIVQHENRLVVLFQESMKARLYNEWDDQDYSAWSNVPETYIMISADYGDTWSDPIILNSLETPELAGQNPAYWYLSDHMEHLYDNWHRIHLMYFDQIDYGSFIQGNGPQTGGRVTYTSLDIDFSSVGINDDPLVVPPEPKLRQNYPNPFNPETTISYNLTTDRQVKLEIFNIRGQHVKTLVDGFKPAGENFAVWNGRDSNNREVGSGIYLYRLDTDYLTETRKMLLIK